MTELLNELKKHPEDVQLQALKKLIQEKLKASLFNTARVLCGYKDVNERTHGEVIASLENDTASKLIVMPRGSLKCLSPKTELYRPNGRTVKAEDLHVGDEVLSWSVDRHVVSKIIGKQINLSQACVRITGRSGNSIVVSKNHPFLTVTGWKRAGNVQVKDRVALWAGAVLPGSVTPKPGVPWLLGMFLGDGATTGGRATLSMSHAGVIKRTEYECVRGGFTLKRVAGKSNWSVLPGIRPILRGYGLAGSLSKEKKIPPAVFNWDVQSRKEFVAAYLSCDATVTDDNKVILTTASSDIAKDLPVLLRTLGVFSVIRTVNMKYAGKPYRCWTVNIVDPISIEQLKTFNCVFKRRELGSVSQDGFYRSVPKEWRKVKKPVALRSQGIRIDNDYDTSFTKFRKFSSKIELSWMASDEIAWDGVHSIEECNSATIDFEIDQTHTMITNGFITHNSSLGCVAYPIWRLLNDPNRAILIDSEVYTNSKNFIREIKAHLASERFQLLIGDWRSDPWNEAEITVAARTAPRKEASITASGVGAVKVGQHFTDIVGDDYNSGNNSATPEARAKVVTHYRMNRAILDPGGIYVIIGTRYAVDDLIGFVLEELGYDPSTGGEKRPTQGLLEKNWAV